MQGDIQGNSRPKSTIPEISMQEVISTISTCPSYMTLCVNTRHVLAHSDVALVRDTQEPDIGGSKGCRTALTIVFPSLRIQGEVETTV